MSAQAMASLDTYEKDMGRAVTSVVAEYYGLLLAAHLAQPYIDERVVLRTDAQLVARQVRVQSRVHPPLAKILCGSVTVLFGTVQSCASARLTRYGCTIHASLCPSV